MKKVILFFTLTAVCLSAYAQINPLELAGIKNVESVEISEDGKFVAYSVSIPADPLKENKSPSSELYVFDVVKEVSVPFISRGNQWSFQFRPKHNSISFLSRRDGGKTALYEISLNGGEAVKLFSYDQSVLTYDWSSDGKNIAFIASGSSKKTSSDFEYKPIIFEENLQYNHAFYTSVSDPHPKQMSVKGHISSVSLSPTNDKMACYVAPTPLIDDRYMMRTLVIVDLASGKITGKVDHKGKKGGISWSPDGQKIAFIAGADINDPTDGRLFVVSSKGGTPKNLKPDFKGKFYSASWLNNNTIQFSAGEGTYSSLGTIESDGSDLKRLLKPEKFAFHSFEKSADGTYAFSTSSPKHASELYIMKKGDKMPIRVTNINPWLDKKKIGRQEVISYKTKDGLTLEGILIYPLKETKAQKYPLIVVVHGGPEAHYSNSFLTSYSNPGQVGATEGFAVFYPNYRGSTGRGLEFAKTSQKDPAGKEFDDIVDAVDHLIKTGIADKSKVGVTGGSYGGYATGWLTTKYTDRFAAGVMFVGISDLVSKWGTTDIPLEEYHVHALSWIWEDYEFWLKRSPIFYADKTKTPLLILGGQDDTRVHPGQSLELYRHIKERTKTPVRLVIYPGEGHGNRKATARLDYNLRMMRWFKKYLLDENIDLDKAIKLDYE